MKRGTKLQRKGGRKVGRYQGKKIRAKWKGRKINKERRRKERLAKLAEQND